MLQKIDRWVIDHPLWVLLVLSLITAILAYFATKIQFSSDLERMLPPEDQVVKEYVEAAEEFGSQAYILVAIQAEESMFNPETLKKIDLMAQELEKLKSKGIEGIQTPLNVGVIGAMVTRVPEVDEQVRAYRKIITGEPALRKIFVSKDESTALIILKEKLAIVDTTAEIDLIDEVVRTVKKYEDPEKIYISGRPYLTALIQKSMVNDLVTLIPIAFLTLMIILFFSFRSIRGVLLPISVVLVSTTWTVGIMALLGAKLTIISIVMPVVLIAIGDADGIHILTRYHQEVESRPNREAIAKTMTSMNRPIIMTSLTSAAGFLGLTSSYSVIVKDFGIFTSVGILIAMCFSLTFIPAALSLLQAPKTVGRQDSDRRALTSIANVVTGIISKRPITIVVIGIVVLVLFAFGIPLLKLDANPLEGFKKGSMILKNTRFIEDQFGGSLTLRIILDTKKEEGLKDPTILKRVVEFQEFMEAYPEVGFTISIADIVRGVNKSLSGDDPGAYRIPDREEAIAEGLMLYEQLTGSGSLGEFVTQDYRRGQVTAVLKAVSSTELGRTVNQIDDYLVQNFPDLETKIVGAPIYIIRLGETLVSSQVKSLLLSLIVIWIMLILSMRTIIIGTVGILPLLFVSVIELGFMGYTNFKLTVGTAMVASIAIGVGVDFAIHFIERFKIAREKGDTRDDAISDTFLTTGKGITFNTASLSLGFSVLLLSSFKTTMHFGLMVGLTALIAFLATMIIIPAVLRIVLTQSRK